MAKVLSDMKNSSTHFQRTWVSDSTVRNILKQLPRAIAEQIGFSKAKEILSLKASKMDAMGFFPKDEDVC